MDNRQYYILEVRRESGPFSSEALQNQYITTTTKIWYSGLESWTNASEIPELTNTMHLLPAKENKGKIWLWITVVALILLSGLFGAEAFLKKKSPINQEVSLNNQELYNRFLLHIQYYLNHQNK